ncbi:MAG: 4-hydroxythreonine-4-phosphate dehydrogenase PdxA [Thiomargarita sp.]|nr:4-hydroxythreonine-4-phosphate dehydrogenase PdxA [Thiomargarita sp.]
MSIFIPRLAITTGEPAAIGPDIVLQLLQKDILAHIAVFADIELLKQRAKQLNLNLQFNILSSSEYRQIPLHKAGHLNVIPISLTKTVTCGQLNSVNSSYVLKMLENACQACLEGYFDALVTAPVHKGIINDAGIVFSGHTEFLAKQTNTQQVVMMLASPELRVALATTHLPLSQVSQAITATHLENTITILHNELKNKLGLKNPSISVCGLNPHAGEGGHLGTEEILTITPVLNKLRHRGMRLIGPISADSAFTKKSLTNIDVVLAMYHDQGLPVLKQHNFGKSVNITLGLPIIRTSVDHGTALELAGTGKATSTSLFYAIQTASEMVKLCPK